MIAPALEITDDAVFQFFIGLPKVKFRKALL